MSGSKSRFEAIKAVVAAPQTGTTFDYNIDHASEIYGSNVFTLEEMQARLPKDVYKSLVKTIESGSKLDTSVACSVASAMAQWAIERGATHYAHVFYPLTGHTAEKHDSFLEPAGTAGAVWEFGGEQLIEITPQSESVWVCACGLSQNFPHCDGSHKKCGAFEKDDAKVYEYCENRKRVVKEHDIGG